MQSKLSLQTDPFSLKPTFPTPAFPDFRIFVEATTANIIATTNGKFTLVSQPQVTRNLTNSSINKTHNYFSREKHRRSEFKV